MTTKYANYAAHALAALSTCLAFTSQILVFGEPSFSLPLTLLIFSVFGIHLCTVITKHRAIAFREKSFNNKAMNCNIYSNEVSKLKQVKIGLTLTDLLLSDLCCAVIVSSLSVISISGNIETFIAFEYGTVIFLGLLNLLFHIACKQDKDLERQAQTVATTTTTSTILNTYLAQHNKKAA